MISPASSSSLLVSVNRRLKVFLGLLVMVLRHGFNFIGGQIF